MPRMINEREYKRDFSSFVRSLLRAWWYLDVYFAWLYQMTNYDNHREYRISEWYAKCCRINSPEEIQVISNEEKKYSLCNAINWFMIKLTIIWRIMNFYILCSLNFLEPCSKKVKSHSTSKEWKYHSWSQKVSRPRAKTLI